MLAAVESNAINGFVSLTQQTPASGSPLPLVGNDPTSQLVATHQNGTGGANTVLRFVKTSTCFSRSKFWLISFVALQGNCRVVAVPSFTGNPSSNLSTLRKSVENRYIYEKQFIPSPHTIPRRSNRSTCQTNVRWTKYLQWLLHTANR